MNDEYNGVPGEYLAIDGRRIPKSDVSPPESDAAESDDTTTDNDGD